MRTNRAFLCFLFSPCAFVAVVSFMMPAFSSLAHAQLPEPRLTVIAPAGGRAGENVTVQITAADAEEAELIFSHPGIHAVRDAKNPRQFVVQIGADVGPGLHDVRVLGKHGVSNPRRFEVGTFPELDASPKALSRLESQEVPLPCVVRGSIGKQQVQWFRVPAQAGQELVFDCRAQELDSRMDPLLILVAEDGRELARSRRKPLVWSASSNEAVFFAVRDFLSNGGPEHFYRLYLAPASALAHRKPESPLVFWPLPEKTEAEVEPNDPSNPQKTRLPFVVRGNFAPARDADAFVFEAKKGEVWWVECVSSRRGKPTHPRVVVERRVDGAEGPGRYADAVEIRDTPWFAGDPDFNGQHFDPVGRFEPKQDGVFRAVIRDMNNVSGDVADRDYVLAIRRPEPDFALVCVPQPPVANKAYATFNGPIVSVRAGNLRPGQVIPLRVLVSRRDGFAGPIQLHAEDLPPGVSAETGMVGTNQDEGTLFLRAAGDAPKWAGVIRVTGSAVVEGREVKRTARSATPVWESTVSEFVEPARNRLMAGFALAVVEDAPVASALHAEQSEMNSSQNGKIRLGIRVERAEPSTLGLKARLSGLPGMEKAKLKDVEIPAKEGRAEYELDLAPLKLSAGTYAFWFRAEEKIKREVKGAKNDVNVSLFSNPVILRIK